MPLRQKRGQAVEKVDTGKARGKHIALVIRGLTGRSGGAEKVYCDLANRLAALGHVVTCYHYDKLSRRLFYPLDDQVHLINLLGPARLPLLWLFWLPSLLSYIGIRRGPLRWMARHYLFSKLLFWHIRRDKPDVIISFMPVGNAASLQAAREVGIPVIVCHHSVPTIDYHLRWGNKLPYSRERHMELLKGAAAIHVLLPQFADFFPSGLRDRVAVIPNFIDLPELSEPRERQKIILGVGRLVALKNYVTLAKAWLLIADRHPDWSVRILGKGREHDLMKACLAANPEAAARFVLAGVTPEIQSEYASASIFCHPSIFEGFGLAPGEALKMGLPVVGFSDCEGLNHLVHHEQNGLLVDRSLQERGLAEALERLIMDEELRARLAAEAPKSVRQYSGEAYMDSWNSLLNRVLNCERVIS